MPFPPLLDSWYLTGPTAGGKTEVGVELAGITGAEIISLDSMALYRGMDVGTAKPRLEERWGVPHHLIDVAEPGDDYSLAQYVAAAHDCVQTIKGRGADVLFVGGTPLYLKGLLRGIFEGPPADWQFRRELEQEASRQGAGFLHARLASVDPVSAARLHPNDTRRLVRALEVFQKTGQPISQLQKQFEQGRTAEECRVFVLDWPRPELYGRIDRRVERMFAHGLVDEVRRLMTLPGGLSKTAAQGLGYREVIDHLNDGPDLAQTMELVKTHTRQFAKRQLTWFRSLEECSFLPVSGQIDPREVARQVVVRSASKTFGSRSEPRQ
jgi:tRNA dimethylallyltransferase